MLELFFFNVGHGDSIAIHFPNNEWGVIDCNYDASISQPQVLTFLQKKNIVKLRFLCITHPHDDHYNGCEKIVDNIEIEKLYLSGMFHEQENYVSDSLGQAIYKFCKRYNRRKLYKNKIYYPLRTHSISIEDVKIKFLNPKASESDFLRLENLLKNDLAYNNVSIVFWLKYNNVNILLSSDSTRECWNEILAQYDDLTSDIVKISHHGSERDNTNRILYSELKEKAIAIISTDGGKRYTNLPSSNVINFIKNNMDSKVLLTSSLNNDNVTTSINANDKLIEAGLDYSCDEINKQPKYDGYIQIIINEDGEITENLVNHI